MRILKPEKYLDNLRSLQIFQVLRYGGIILTNILLAKSVLSLGEIGVFETLVFLGTGISFFWVSGFLRGLLPVFPGLRREDQRSFLFNVFLLFCGVSVAVTSIFYLAEGPILRLLTEYQHLPYYELLCIYILINTPTYLVEYFYLLTKQPLRIVQFGLFSSGLHVIAVAAPIFLGYTLEESFQALILLSILKFGWLGLILFQETDFIIRPSLLKPYIWLSIPLILNLLVSGGAEYIDGVIVHRFFDQEAFAIFRYGARELPLALALTTAFSAALIPVVAEDLQKGMDQIKARSRKLMHLLFMTSIFLMVLSPFLFPIVFSPAFAGSAIIFNIYLLILISRLLFPQTIIIGLKRTDIILWVSIVELFVNVFLSLWFVRIWGLSGIAFATVIAFALDKILLIGINTIKFKIPLNRYLDVRLFSIYSILLILSFFISLQLL